MRSKKEKYLLEKLEAEAQQQGFDLVDIELTGSSRNSLLRVYIDKEDGLTLDEVASANTWISTIVEAMDPYSNSYTLEVSSPGIDRPLRTWEHFEKAVGEEVSISLEGATKKKEKAESKPKQRLKYTGTLVSADPKQQQIILESAGVQHALGFTQIKKARIKGRLDFESRKDS